MHFLEVLREECGVVSAKDGCAPEGTCGCCLVMIDGHPALSCLRKPEQMEGRDVVTVEGLPDDTRRILSEAFVLEGGVQCGFCIPGILVRAASLMQQGRADDRGAVAKALDGHLCRCTGYGRIIDAIQTAGEAAPRRAAPEHRATTPFVLRRRVRLAPESRVRPSNRGQRQRQRPRHWPIDRAPRRTGADARRKAVCRRHARARHAARGDGDDRSSARQDPEDSHRRSGGDARRRPRVHGGRRPRKAGAPASTIRTSRCSSPKAS